jgi:hypothetical protein
MNAGIPKSSILIGVILLLISFAPGHITSRQVDSEDALYTGLLVVTNGDILVEAITLTNNSFSLYLLDFDSGVRLVDEASLANVTPILAIEDIDRYVGVIDLPTDDAYFLVVTNSSTSPSVMRVVINIWRATPHLRVLALGSILIAIGVIFGRKQILNILNQIQRKRKGD